MRLRAHRIRSLALIACLTVLPVAGGAAPGDGERRWEVTFAIRLPGDSGRRVSARLALPRPGFERTVDGVEVTGRGLDSEVTLEGGDPHVLLRGTPKTARRVAVRYELTSRRLVLTPPAVIPLDFPPPELLPYLAPSRVFQSRSLLVREFLETRVAPALDAPNGGLLRPIYEQTRAALRWQARGKTLPLEVIRRGGGQRLGIERSFVTLLRCARIPARLAEGIDLEGKTRQKRVFWTEAWSDGRWWPVSASRGWFGRMPASYVPLTVDGNPVLSTDPPGDVAYQVHSARLGALP